MYTLFSFVTINNLYNLNTKKKKLEAQTNAE